jgi:hypothetical protein
MGISEMKYDQMRDQALGEPAGQAVFSILEGREAARCWDAYKGLTAAEYRYHRIVLGQSPFAKTAKIEFMPERLEASADDPPEDTRSEEERQRDAVNARQRWKGLEMQLSAPHRVAIHEAFLGTSEPMKDGNPTRSGIVLVSALQILANIVDKH